MDGVAVYSNTKKSRRRGGGIAVVGSRGPGVVLSSGETSVLRLFANSGRGVISRECCEGTVPTMANNSTYRRCNASFPPHP